MFNFHTYDSELQKVLKLTPICNALLATALALLITGCVRQTFTVQNKPAAVAPKETITHHFSASGIGQKKTVDAAKICGGAENVVKTETQQTFVNGLLGFITLGIYNSLEARIEPHIGMSCPSIWATLSALLINISGFLPVVFA